MTTYTYNALNQCISVKDALNNVIRYGYDALGRRITITDARGNVFTTTYDGNGNVIKTTDAKGNTISETVYNSLNQPLTVTDAMGKVTTYTYNALGKVESVTDSLNHRTEFTYNSRGQNTAVRDAANNVSSATYDLLGNVTRLAGPLGGATNYTYDDMGRLTSESTVSGGTKSYEYNELNIRKKITNARGQVRQIFYDAMGRITGYNSPEGSVSYTYDVSGNVLTVVDSHGTITRTYDALNRVSNYTDTYGKVIRYEYDAVGNLSKIIYPDNTAVTYAYDGNHNLIRVTDWANRVTSYTYDVNNRVVGVTKPDGSVTTTVYDNKQRVTSTVERTVGGVIITGFEYTYDDLSRIIEEKVLANSTKMCYTYDSLGRVTARTVKQISDDSVISTETFTYDAAGNITGTSTDTAIVYDLNNRLTSFNGNAVSYDLDGNMLNNGTISFTYDSANRLITAGGHTYTYNAEDVRIRNLCTDEDTTYTYDTNSKLSKLLTKTTDNVVTKYVYGRGLIGEEVSNAFKTYHFDCRGSTIAITDASGNITDTFAYDTYGKLTSRTGTSAVIFGYNGRDGVVTDDNGLIYMRARYYSPDMRRFINADIVAGEISNAITLNRFAYANGNPVSFVDPFGLSAERSSISDEQRMIFLAILSCALNSREMYTQLNDMKRSVRSYFTLPISTLEYDFTIGDIRNYCKVSHTFGEGEIDISKLNDILEGQVEISNSYDFANGEFVATYGLDGSHSITYSTQMDPYNTVKACVKFGKNGSFAGEYIIQTNPQEFQGHSVTTTYGIEGKNAHHIQPNPAPAAKAELSLNEKILANILFGLQKYYHFRQSVGDAVENFFRSLVPAPSWPNDLKRPELDPFPDPFEQEKPFTPFYPVPLPIPMSPLLPVM